MLFVLFLNHTNEGEIVLRCHVIYPHALLQKFGRNGFYFLSFNKVRDGCPVLLIYMNNFPSYFVKSFSFL
jgi:hypothetical protein